MKKTLFNFLGLGLLAITLTFTVVSCTEDDPCKDVVCGTNGECFEGECVCNVGYEQDAAGQCNVERRAKYVGSFNMTESCTEAGTGTVFPATYTMTVATSTDGVSVVTLQGLGDSGTTIVKAVIGEDDAITVNADSQISVGGTAFKVLNATGTISGTTLTMSYELANPADNAVEYTCTATGTKN